VLKGLETLDLRIRRQSENALKVGQFVEGRVPRILHPGLPSHPQYALAQKQMDTGGTIFSIDLDGGREQAHALLDALQLIDISNNIGDSRSLMCHPASTTHHGVGPETRADMGVGEGMLRLNVGLEDPDDLIEDLDRALSKAGL
jgi:cystathionine gamma-synthase/O-succinylhomoserine sulfhydrylase